MRELIKTITLGDFQCDIVHEDGRVHYIADADIDADGANGQNGRPAAYRADDKGSDYLANGGMGLRNGRVVCLKEWARNVVILGTDGEPRVFPGGVVASKTAYRIPGRKGDDPTAYVDSETVAFLVVPPSVLKRFPGKVLGCKARVSLGGMSIDCVAADVGPAKSPGEVSIEAARQLGMPESPRNGGREKTDVLYELWPAQPAPGYELQ